MMKHFLDDGVFEQGVQNYLKERAFKNANVDHLWQELTYVSILILYCNIGFLGQIQQMSSQFYFHAFEL